MELSGSEQEGPGERVQARDSGDRGFLKELDRENRAAGVSGRAAGGWEQEGGGSRDGEASGRREEGEETGTEGKIQERGGPGQESAGRERGNLMRAA